MEEAVPTGITAVEDQLLVTLFRGAPFAPGTSVAERIDRVTGSHSPFITGLKTAIDVLPVPGTASAEYLVLQHASVGPFFGGRGLLLRLAPPAGPPSLVTNCLTLPTSMTLDRRTGTLYLSQLGGSIVAITVP